MKVSIQRDLLGDTERQNLGTYLEYTPWDTAKDLSKSQNAQRRSKERNEYSNGHPSHEKHHGLAAAESILAVTIDEKANELPDDRRIR